MLITFANTLDLDQDRQNVGPDLYPNYMRLLMFLKEFLKRLILKKVSRQQHKHEKLPSMQRDKVSRFITTFNIGLHLLQVCQNRIMSLC